MTTKQSSAIKLAKWVINNPKLAMGLKPTTVKLVKEAMQKKKAASEPKFTIDQAFAIIGKVAQNLQAAAESNAKKTK